MSEYFAVACEGKIPYTRAQAKSVRQRMKDQTGETKLYVYPCPFCHHFHVGATPPKKPKVHKRFNLDLEPEYEQVH